jgi:hypothetical protein
LATSGATAAENPNRLHRKSAAKVNFDAMGILSPIWVVDKFIFSFLSLNFHNSEIF